MSDWSEGASLFLLGFSSLLPLINPLGTALIMNPYFAASSTSQRRSYALFICAASFSLGVASLLAGSWALKFMGISIPTTQIAGGLIIARMGMSLLSSESNKDKDKENTDPHGRIADSLFYPLAFPLTLGPGSISVLIALSAHAHMPSEEQTLQRMAVLCLSLLSVMIVTYLCIAYSSVIVNRMGPTGSQVLNRLMAFLVFCVGLQLVVTGLSREFPHLFN
jgi:multiple antibiotic resistance protein